MPTELCGHLGAVPSVGRSTIVTARAAGDQAVDGGQAEARGAAGDSAELHPPWVPCGAQSRSMMVALAMPPASHIVCRP